MKREKFSERGHQWRYGNCWHNFCVKCGYPKGRESRILTAEFNCLPDFENVERKYGEDYFLHEFDGNKCIKCGISVDGALTLVDKKLYIHYNEERFDRVIERYYCIKFKSEYRLEIPCLMSDDDYLVKDVIL